MSTFTTLALSAGIGLATARATYHVLRLGLGREPKMQEQLIVLTVCVTIIFVVSFELTN